MKLSGMFGKILKPHPDVYRTKENLIERFETVDEKALKQNEEVMFSFLREHCLRGNARQFRIMVDDREAAKIPLDGQCNLVCEPGFHRIYVKLDTLVSPVLNVKAEIGCRYFFDIACTMEDGMILQRVDNTRKEKEGEYGVPLRK